MFFVAFGKWERAANRHFVQKRIYWRGYKWTPFVRVKRRRATLVEMISECE